MSIKQGGAGGGPSEAIRQLCGTKARRAPGFFDYRYTESTRNYVIVHGES